MNFFRNIIDSVKKKNAEMKERKEFLDMVERKARPIRRMAYMKQMLKEVVEEGKAKAMADAASRKPKKQKKEEDFGFSTQIGDPMKYFKEASKDKKTKSKETNNEF